MPIDLIFKNLSLKGYEYNNIENAIFLLKRFGVVEGSDVLHITESGRSMLTSKPETIGNIVVFDTVTSELPDTRSIDNLILYFVCAYTYNGHDPDTFGDIEIYKKRRLNEFFSKLEDAYKIVGHNVVNFDYAILKRHGLPDDLIKKLEAKTFDVYDVIKDRNGERYSLDVLSNVNLQRGKKFIIWERASSGKRKLTYEESVVNDIELIKGLHDLFINGEIELSPEPYSRFKRLNLCPNCNCSDIRVWVNYTDKDLVDLELIKNFMPRCKLLKKCVEYSRDSSLFISDKNDIQIFQRKINDTERCLNKFKSIDRTIKTNEEQMILTTDLRALRHELESSQAYKRLTLFRYFHRRAILTLKRKVPFEARTEFLKNKFGSYIYCARCKKKLALFNNRLQVIG